VIVDEVIASLASVAAILVVGGVILLLVVSRQRRADPRWRRISTIAQGVVLAVFAIAAVAVFLALSSDDPRLRF